MDRRRAAAALLALAACIACSAAAPMASNHTALELHDGPVEGCYYNFQHYGEGDRIMTNEPCLNCTCHNRMLMCYLRVCPFTKAIGQDCTVEKRADQCCPIVTCPDVPVDLLTSTSTSSPAEYGATGIGKLDKYGCSIHGKYFPEGSKVPPTPNKPCEHCYCIRNMTTCVMQECTLHVDGCTPIYHKDVCCPVRYSCDHPEDEIPLLDDMTTTVRPTQGFLLTTTTMSPVTQISQDCVHDDQIFADGALIRTEKACEHCYCMKGDIVCVVQECGTPMENEGKNCTSLPPRHGQCCPDTYICEGDERVTETTTEFGELTSLPPRRVGVEGSGYRNEPDDAYTEISPVTTEIEGSGEDFATGSDVYTGENVTPEKEIIDETLLTTTDTNLHLSQSTEPDKGQNTIPDSITDKETAQEPIQNELSSSSFDETMTTGTKDYTTVRDLTSRKEEIGTTESVFKIDSESNFAETLTPEEHEKATSESTHLLDTTTFSDEIIPYTNPTITESDQKATTRPSTENTKAQETSKQEELSTEIYVHSGVTEKDTDIFHTSPESEILIESTTYPVTNIVIAESTSINPNINEVDDNGSLLPRPSRIPGEGDCLLNGITYTNNTSVPSTNNCHTGCKCISSIIKCDPIICSPPPEYMENMNDCQPVYDTPNSCCPTYVCSVQETIPPESHSHISGTESPKPIAVTECSGNDCNDVDDNKLPSEPTICTSGNCLSETPSIEKECESNDCKDQTSQSIPTQDCSNGKCQILPTVPCEGENCKDATPETDSESTKTTAIQEKCESNDCKDQVQTTPSKPSQECSDGKCEISPTTLCEGDECTVQPTKEAIPEKDLEPGLQDVPSKICNEENGCDDSNTIIMPKECVGESCRRKDFPEEEKVPLKCSGSECKQQDEPTAQSTEQATEIVTEGSTITDKNLQNTATIESHITSSDELVTELVTKRPIDIESPGILSTTLEQIVTESPDKYGTGKETIQTDGPSIQTITEISEEVVKEALPTEPSKLSADETTESQVITSPTDERITSGTDLTYTKEPEYLETDTKEAFTTEIELLSTDKPHIYTDSHSLDEKHTKLPEIPVTESEKSPTEAPELVISETDGMKTESLESITQKEEFVTNAPEKFGTEKETIHSAATETSIAVTEAIQTTPFEKIMENETKQPETLEAVTEKEVLGTIPDLVITEKEQVIETFTDQADTQTVVPETYATEKEVIVTETSKVTAEDKDIIQTEIPEIVDAVKVTSITESPEITDSEKKTIQTEYPDIAITTKYPNIIESELPTFTEKMQTMSPDATITAIDEVLTNITEITKRKEDIDVSTPDLHKTKLESTTEHELDQTSLEEQTSISSNLGTNDDESVYVTKETISIPTVTEIPNNGEDKELDQSHEPKSTKPDEKTEISTESLVTYTTYEIETERKESDVTKPEIMPEDTHIGVTESIRETTLSETAGEITTKKTQVTEEPEIYTKLPQGTETEAEAVTDKNLFYTSRPDVHETKSDDSSQSIDMSVTESQMTVTKAPGMLSTQYAEISTVHDAIVTDKYKEVPDRKPESTSLPIHDIAEKQDQDTEAPETYSTILQAQDKTTILPEQYTTLVEAILTTEKGPYKQYETPSSDSNLEEDKELPEIIHQTTLKNIDELATTEISNFVTEIPDMHSTEPQKQSSIDQKLDTESSLLTTKIEDSVKEPESSTVLLTDIDITHAPEFIEEIEQDLTTKIPQQDIATETYKEKTSDNLPSHSTYKDELSTEQPITQEFSNTKAETEPYVETSTKTIMEIEKEIEDQVTTPKPQPTKSSDTSEFESALPFTNTPESEISTQKDTITYTPKDEDKTIPHDTEKDGSKPFVSDEKPSDATEESGLQEVHTTQTSLPNVEDVNKNVQESNEVATEGPESITTYEQSTLAIEDRITTESHVSYTSPEDKLSTMVVDNKEIQKEQHPDYNDFLTTSTSLQPEDYKKITELPMSQITHIDHALSPQTTVVYEEEMTEQSSKTTVEQKLEEEKAQTSESELQNQSTETSNYHDIQQVKETESSTVGDDFGIDHAEKTTMPVMEDEYSIDRKPTTVSQQETDFSKDITTPEIESHIYTEGTPVTDTKEVVIDTKPPETTTVLLPVTEIEPDLSHKQETSLTESIGESVTKLPQNTQTDQKEITTTPSILPDDEHLKETISTEAVLSEHHGLATEYPETDVHDMHSISPEKETVVTAEDMGTGTPEISTEKEFEPATSVYVPTVATFTEKPITLVTEINEPVISEKDHKPNEILTYLEATTTYVNLEETTEKGISYTHSKPLYTTEAQNTVTQSKESSTEVLDRATTAPDQTITNNLDKDKIDEHISPHSSTQIPEISTFITLTQTETTGIEKTTLTMETPSEKEKPTLTEKEDEIQPEKLSTESTIEKEISSTESTPDLSNETEKVVADVHIPTEFMPTTSEKSYTETQTTQTHKVFDIIEETKQTTEQGHEFSETTPFLVELKEHTHQIIDESSRTPVEEILTTPLYEPQQTERGDQNLDVTDKYEDEYQTSVPIKVELDQENKEKPITHGQEQVEDEVTTMSSITVKDYTDHIRETVTISTSSSALFETEIQDKEKLYTTTVQDVVLTTSAAPQTVSEKEAYATMSGDVQNFTYPVPESSSLSTEKDILLVTEEPLKSEVSIGTTLIDEDLLRETSKTTTSKVKEETTTQSLLTDKSTQLEEKPFKPTPSPPTQELTKPEFDDEINEGIPSPDFPPSGAGGYGQEPDYIEEDQAFGPGTCRYGGKVYVSAQQIPRDDPCDFCFCFRSDIICLQQSCPPPIHGCHEEPIQGFCCPRYECPVSMATTLNVTTTTTTTTTTLPPHFLPHAYKGAAQRRGCQIKGHTYKVGEVVRASSGPCLHCTCGGDGQMKCDPKACTPEPMLRQMIAAAVSAKRRR